MKTVHFKHNTYEPQYKNSPRLYCDTRLHQRHRVQSKVHEEVTCNRCRFLLRLPEVACAKPYRKTLHRERAQKQLKKDTHFDCGAYLFCDQRAYAKGYKVGGQEAVTCFACDYLLKTKKKNISEHMRKGYRAVRGDLIYTPSDLNESDSQQETKLKDEKTRKDSHAP